MKQIFTTLSFVLFFFSLTGIVFAQEDNEETKEEIIEEIKEELKEEEKDSIDKKKTFKDYITDEAESMEGMLTVHKVEDKYYFEIPDSLLGREILAVTRLSKTPTGMGYGGEEANEQTFRFSEGPNDKIFIEIIQHMNMSADEEQPITMAVRNSNLAPIAAAFDILAEKKDTSTLIEVSDFFIKPNDAFSMRSFMQSRYKLQQVQDDRSFIQSMNAYPINVEVKTMRTYKVPPPPLRNEGPTPTVDLPAGTATGFLTVEMNTSMILLPKEPARKRFFDPRVGIFTSGYNVFDENEQRVQEQTFTVRWPLEAKNEADIERQKAGEAVEPKEPIVFYIDPATPEKWRPYLKQGVEDWQVAFEQAGWKNAIQAKDWPVEDSTMSLEDSRFSVIRYFASDIQNAYGPNIHDPRSGEIIESHIGWYHNITRLLKNWYTTQTGASDPRSRPNDLDDELMGELVRFVSAHEVGHTLGLRHNFGASYATPVEKLRDAEWLKNNPHTSSIMDYARFNYVAQPDDNVETFFPGIGEYDKWAIEWNYKPIYGTDSPEEDRKILNQWYLEKAENNPALHFITESSSYDPRAQSEDIGNNSMIASEYGIENLKRILPNTLEWTEEEARHYDRADEMYSNIFGQFRRYIGHVTKWVGGVYETPKTYDQEGFVYEPAPAEMQKDAVKFLHEQLFQEPDWLLNQEITQMITPERGVNQIKQLQESTINRLYATDRLQRLIESKTAFPETAYGLVEFFEDMNNGIWKEAKDRKTANVFRRNLQKVHLAKLIELLEPTYESGPSYGWYKTTSSVNTQMTDISSLSRGVLTDLHKDLKRAARGTKDKLTKYHYQDCKMRIEEALDMD